jgi:hypothetical protein
MLHLHLIPEQVVSYENTTPFHEIPMYRTLLAHHISLLVRIIPCQYNNNYEKLEQPFNGSFIKENEIDKKRFPYQLPNGNVITFPIKEQSIYFTLVFKQPCFFYNCNLSDKNIQNMFCVKHELTIFLVFLPAKIEDDIHNLSFYYTRTYEQYRTFDITNLKLFFANLRQILPNCSQIVLNGQSNGFAAATCVSFLLLCIKSTTFREKHKSLLGPTIIDELFVGNELEEFHALLQDKTIFVAGTGGFPVLFSTLEQFKDYYNELQGRYVHVLSGIVKAESIFIDNFASPLSNLYNYKFGIYYQEHIDEALLKKYNGTKYFLKVVTNESILDTPPEYVEEFFPPQPYDPIKKMYKNKNTDKYTWFPLSKFNDKIGNNFLFCDHKAYLENNPNPSFKDCRHLLKFIHQLDFYQALLSLFVYDTWTVQENAEYELLVKQKAEQEALALQRNIEEQRLLRQRQIEERLLVIKQKEEKEEEERRKLYRDVNEAFPDKPTMWSRMMQSFLPRYLPQYGKKQMKSYHKRKRCKKFQKCQKFQRVSKRNKKRHSN